MSIEVVKIREFIGHSQAVYALSVHPTTRKIYSSGADGLLVEWNMSETDGVLVAKLDSAAYVLQHIEGNLYAGTHKGYLSVFDSELQLQNQIKVAASPIFDVLRFGDDFVVASGDGQLRIFNQRYQLLKQVAVSNKSIRQIQVLPDGLVCATSEGELCFLNPDYTIIQRLSAHEGSVFSMAFVAATDCLYSGGKDAQIVSHQRRQFVDKTAAHMLHVHSLAFNASNNLLLSGSMDKEIRLWLTPEMKLLKVVNFQNLEGHRSSVNKILWFDKNNFISCSDDRTIKCYAIQSKK